jgi:predicted alpha/beta hydrolase
MQMWSIEDDKTFGPAHAVDKLATCFATSAGQVERLHLRPRVVGHKAVGHFGVFKKTSATRIWPLLLQSIEAKVPRLRGG